VCKKGEATTIIGETGLKQLFMDGSILPLTKTTITGVR